MDRWSQALTKALAAQEILSACQWGPIQEWEKAEKGLEALFERFCLFSLLATFFLMFEPCQCSTSRQNWGQRRK